MYMYVWMYLFKRDTFSWKIAFDLRYLSFSFEFLHYSNFEIDMTYSYSFTQNAINEIRSLEFYYLTMRKLSAEIKYNKMMCVFKSR